MKMKNILLLILALCMVFALCACGADNNKGETTQATQNETQQTTVEVVDDGKVTYVVKVVDEAGNGIAGAMVQLCLESCIPALTNAEGVASYNVEEADYKVSFVSMPEGFTSDVNEFHFDEGFYEMTITLKAAA